MFKHFSWISFVSLSTLCLLGECYQVTITSSPPSPIPFDYGSINLICSISPLPPAPVYYTWTSIYQYWSTPTYVNNTPTATLDVDEDDAPRFPVFYCHVHSGDTKVTEGKITLQLQGYLSHGENIPIEYNTGDDVTLSVDITDDDVLEYIKSFGWFYNNTPIFVCSCSSHYILNNDNKTLTIVNASAADVGVYEARITSYQIYGYSSELCDKTMNEVLEYHAALAPVMYTLSYKNYEEKLSVNAATISQEHTIVAKINESLLYNRLYGKMEIYDYSGTFLYQNGYLNQFLLSSNGTFYGTNEFRLLVNISTYQEDEAGEYFVIGYADSDLLFYVKGCPVGIDLYFFLLFDLRISDIIWHAASMQILTAVPPKVMVVADKLSLKMEESTTLNCTASNGVPESHVSWIKNGQCLINATTITIPYNNALVDDCILPFGEYTCVVFNDLYNLLHPTLIQEKVSLQSLWTINIKIWQLLNLMAQDMVMDAISAELIQEIDSLCKQCGITSDHFINSTFEVIDETMHSVIGIYYTSYIAYSSPEGDVTASTLVTLLQQWLLEAEENEMQVTVGETHLVIYKPCGLDNNNPNSKSMCLISLSTRLQMDVNPSAPSISPLEPCLNIPSAQSPAVIAGIVMGGILAGALCTVIAALSCLFVHKRFSSHPTNNTNTEIELKDNAAYEQINLGVRPRPQAHLPKAVQQQQEDHIYDL